MKPEQILFVSQEEHLHFEPRKKKILDELLQLKNSFFANGLHPSSHVPTKELKIITPQAVYSLKKQSQLL